MSLWDGKTRGGTSGYKFFIFILRIFPLSVSYFFLYFVAFYFLFITKKNIKALRFYFRIIHKKSLIVTLLYIYKNYLIFGKVLVDKVASMLGFGNKFTYTFEGEELINEIVSQGKGGLLIGAHFGNWEIASHLFNRINRKINIVLMDAEHRQIKTLLENNNNLSLNNVDIITIGSDLDHIIKIKNALQNGELVCIQADRYLDKKTAVEVDFLGHKALFPIGPFKLAKTLNVPVLYTFAVKETSKHYYLHAIKPDILENGNNNLANNLLMGFVEAFSRKVKKFPTQWFNYYQFWLVEE